jgi:hypothetical protein
MHRGVFVRATGDAHLGGVRRRGHGAELGDEVEIELVAALQLGVLRRPIGPLITHTTRGIKAVVRMRSSAAAHQARGQGGEPGLPPEEEDDVVLLHPVPFCGEIGVRKKNSTAYGDSPYKF